MGMVMVVMVVVVMIVMIKMFVAKRIKAFKS